MTLNNCSIIDDIYTQKPQCGIIQELITDTKIAELFKQVAGVEDTTPIEIDYRMHSQTKYVSNYTRFLFDSYNSDDEASLFTPTGRSIFGTMFRYRFYDKWKQLAELTIKAEDALTPYDMLYDEKGTKKGTDATETTSNSDNSMTIEHGTTTTRTGKNTSDNSTTDSGTITDEGNDNTTSAHNVFAYNANPAENSAVPDSAEESTVEHNLTRTVSDTITGKSTDNIDVTDAVTGTDTHRSNGQESKTETLNLDEAIDKTIMRKGNIGNITKQQLLQQQRDILQWQFWDRVFDDIDSILCAGMYDTNRPINWSERRV